MSQENVEIVRQAMELLSEGYRNGEPSDVWSMRPCRPDRAARG